jgi:hypothetical protein
MRWLLIVISLSVATGTQASGEPIRSPDHAREIGTILSFYQVLTKKEDPSIADFIRLFGPHDESEVEAILRLALHERVDKVPPKEVVDRVNTRINSPERYPSLFLKCLRTAEPHLFATNERRRLEFPAEVSADGFMRFRVSSRGKDVTFVFDGQVEFIEAVYLPSGLEASGLLARCATMPRRWNDSERQGK